MSDYEILSEEPFRIRLRLGDKTIVMVREARPPQTDQCEECASARSLLAEVALRDSGALSGAAARTLMDRVREFLA